MNIEIIQEEASDFEGVYLVNELAFGQKNEGELVNRLRNSKVFVPELSLVAICNDGLIGHILFTKIEIETSTGKRHESLTLAPMAVKPKFQNKGIGSRLIEFGLTKAKALAFKSVIVLGHEHYYPKFGFLPAEKWSIKPPFKVPVKAFMALELQPGALQNVSGMVKYPSEFDGV